MTPTTAPKRPRPTVLRRTSGGRLPSFRDPSGRFTVSRNPAEPGVPFEDSGYDVVDTRRANILGHGHTNRVRVYELADARAEIDKVVVREYLGALQRHLDAEREAAGLPSVAEEAATARKAERTRLTP